MCGRWFGLSTCLVVLALSAAGLSQEAGRKPRALLDRAGIEVKDLPASLLADLGKLKEDDPRWKELFPVRLQQKEAGETPALSGSYSIEGAALRFAPKYPLQPGLTYRLEFDATAVEGSTKLKNFSANVTVPARKAVPTTIVEQVYPTADRLPENHLRFYLTFSAPMSIGEVADRVHLLDAEGKIVKEPFLDLAEEMWGPDRKRLTLLIHPGRIKRGLRSYEEAGQALVAGRKYSLVIDRNWPDGEGVPLKQDFRKEFTVAGADLRPLDSREWQLSRPAAGSREPLAVQFPKPLDRALLERLIWVEGPDGKAVAGTVAIEKGETRWKFTPDQPWPSASVLVVDTALEDPCGNRLGRAFDLDVNDPAQAAKDPVTGKILSLPIKFR